jgi:ABC-type transport system involved in multi-copper enzyme maturation permease subunit
MIRLFRVEMLKIRTSRASFGILLTSASLTILFAVLSATRVGEAGSGVGPLNTTSGLLRVTTLTGWSMMFAGAFGVMVANGEFRHGTATLTYLAEPNRTRVLTAKAMAAFCSGSLFGLASAVISTGVGLAFVASKGYPVTLTTTAMIGHGIGAMLGASLFAVIGVGLGSLIRSQLAGVIGIFVWGLIVESTIGGLFTSVRPFLPYTAATTLAGIKLGAAAVGPANGSTSGAPLAFVASASLVAFAALVLAAIANQTTVRRDVS